MDQGHDRAEIFGQDVALNLISFGHYCTPIDKTENIPVEAVCAVKLGNISEAERQNVLLKLHGQFAHPSKRRRIALLKDAGVWDGDYLDILITIAENYQLCKCYTKPPHRPLVSLTMVHEFIQKFAMDLKRMEGAQDSAHD